MITEAQYRAIAESLPDGLLVVDGTDAVRLYNPAAGRIFGYEAEEVLGHDIRLLMDVGSVEAYEALSREGRAGKGGTVSREMSGVHKNGAAIHLRMAINRIGSDDGPLLTALVCDISGEKCAEQEFRRMQAETLHAAKLAAVGELAAGAAHEINNPLTGIINYAQILLDVPSLDKRQAGMLQKIIDGGMRISGIVNNLRRLARSSPGAREEVQVADLIESSMQLVGAQLRNHGVQVKIDLAVDLPRLRCSATDIQQIFMNLITNAREALDERFPGADAGKILDISGRAFNRDGREYVRLEFYDHGCGMAQEVMEHLSVPFFSTKDGDQHAGLGLFAGFAIAREHGGCLRFESEEGAWTKVTVELPTDGRPLSD
ncbi:MAG TPA: PAS domain S-box protein [Mariprofundaceae bacterium]|nr:PAS domain S-box protein [Mariprofundaceae bacterium]